MHTSSIKPVLLRGSSTIVIALPVDKYSGPLHQRTMITRNKKKENNNNKEEKNTIFDLLISPDQGLRLFFFSARSLKHNAFFSRSHRNLSESRENFCDSVMSFCRNLNLFLFILRSISCALRKNTRLLYSSLLLPVIRSFLFKVIQVWKQSE